MEKLGENPVGSGALAAGTKADPTLVARTLKHLIANGLVKEVGRDLYVATPFSIATNDPTIGAGLTYSFEGRIPTFQGLPEFLAKMDYETPSDSDHGPVQYGLKTDKPFFSILQSHPRLGSALNNFMAGYAKARPRWVDFYPINKRLGFRLSDLTPTGPLLVDVGDGLGHELSAFHASNESKLPGQLVLQDLPSKTHV